MAAAMRVDPVLLAASAAFAGACAFGSVVAVREDVPGEPFGIAIPLTVHSGIVVGWGAGVAAPWPMPVAALIAGTTAGRAERSAAPGYVSAGLGIACVAGTFIEPVTYRRRSWTPAIRAAIAVNLAASAALAAAGWRHATLGQRPC